MSVVLIRIDDRLVHGQVVEGWVKHLQATKVTVISELILNNTSRQKIMEYALPANVKFQSLGVDDIVRRGDLTKSEDDENEIVLFDDPANVLNAIKKGLRLGTINLGGMHHFSGNKILTTNIALNEQDVLALKGILEEGVSVKVQALPADNGIDLKNLL